MNNRDISPHISPFGRPAPVTLEGSRVRLEPLGMGHLGDLERAGGDPSIWRWLPSDHSRPGTMRAFVREALGLRDLGLALPFATVDLASGRAVGSTRYHYIEMHHRRLEIGFTWITPSFQRTHVNTESKLLLLGHAFDALGCRRVELKVDSENTRSRDAVLRLGAREEGLFRKHMLYPDGRNRDSVYFALLDEEWPGARARLVERLARSSRAAATAQRRSDVELETERSSR